MSGSAEQAVRMKALALLRGDAALAGQVHGVFDGVPPRATAPYILVGGAEGSDWGTKDRPGREVRLTLALVGAGAAADHAAMARIESAATALRGPAGDWTVVGARTVRTRFILVRENGPREGGWRHEILVRCRCLAE